MKLYENNGIIDKELDDEINLICDKVFEEVYTEIDYFNLKTNKNNHEFLSTMYSKLNYELNLNNKEEYVIETANSFNSNEIEFTLQCINNEQLYYPNQIVTDTITINMNYLESLNPPENAVFIFVLSHPKTGKIFIDHISLEKLIGNIVFNTAFDFDNDTKIVTFKLWEYNEDNIDIFYRKGIKEGLVYFNHDSNFRLGLYNFTLETKPANRTNLYYTYFYPQILNAVNPQIIKGIKTCIPKTTINISMNGLNIKGDNICKNYYWRVTFNNVDYFFAPFMRLSKDTLKRYYCASTIYNNVIKLNYLYKLCHQITFYFLCD